MSKKNGSQPPPQFGDLSARAIATDLDFHLWLPKVTDKEVSNQVADQYKITRKAGRYEKNLFPFPAEQRVEYDELAVALHKVYQYWHRHTLPWGTGVRLLKSTFFGDFNQFMKLEAEHIEVLKRKFKKVYPEYIIRAEQFMKSDAAKGTNKRGIFRRQDYPDWSKLDTQFGFEVFYDPVVASGDFRLELDAALMEELRKNHTSKYAKSQAEMMKRMWEGVHETLMRAANLSSSSTNVYDTIFSGLTELADSLPSLNLFDDPEISAVATEIKNNLYDIDPHLVRTDGGERQEVARKAQRIADRMRKLMI